MKREIKFRYWDTFNAEMNICQHDQWPDYLSKFFIEHDIVLEADNNPILMQHTGVDNIFEGDIVKAFRRDDAQKKDPRIDKVTFLNGCFMAFNCTMHELYKLYQSDLKVIGNIYEHPERLLVESI